MLTVMHPCISVWTQYRLDMSSVYHVSSRAWHVIGFQSGDWLDLYDRLCVPCVSHESTGAWHVIAVQSGNWIHDM